MGDDLNLGSNDTFGFDLYGDPDLSLGWLTDPNAKPYLNPSWLGSLGSVADLSNLDLGGLSLSDVWNQVKGLLPTTPAGITAGAAGLAALMNAMNKGSGSSPTGYQGGIPLYTASREQTTQPVYTPYAQFDSTKQGAYRPGQGGVTYFTPMKYEDTGITPKTASEFLGGVASLPQKTPPSNNVVPIGGAVDDAATDGRKTAASAGAGTSDATNGAPSGIMSAGARYSALDKNAVYDATTGRKFLNPAAARAAGVTNYVTSLPSDFALPSSMQGWSTEKVASEAAKYGMTPEAFIDYERQAVINRGFNEAYQKAIDTQSGGMSPQDLIAKLNYYKTNPPKNEQEYRDQQALWADYTNRYSNSTYDYANMGGVSKDQTLAPTPSNEYEAWINKSTGEMWRVPKWQSADVSFGEEAGNWAKLDKGIAQTLSAPGTSQYDQITSLAPNLAKDIGYLDQLIASTPAENTERLRYLNAARNELLTTPWSSVGSRGPGLMLDLALGSDVGGRTALPEYAQWLPYEKVLQAYTTEDPRAALQYFNREAMQQKQMPSEYYDVIGTVGGIPVTKHKIDGRISLGERSLANATSLTDAIEYFGLTADEINQLDKLTQGKTDKFSDISDMFATLQQGRDPEHAQWQDELFEQQFGYTPYENLSETDKAARWNEQLAGLGISGTDPYTGGLTANAASELRQVLEPERYAAQIESLKGLVTNPSDAAQVKSALEYAKQQGMTPAQLAEAFGATLADAEAVMQQYGIKLAAGGAIAMNQGGLASLATGGRYIQGPGDGVSDSVPAVIQGAGGGQPAKLADGEFVFPARIVAEIGNGSNNAGARKLYALLDRIEARAKSAKRGKPSGADKELNKLA